VQRTLDTKIKVTIPTVPPLDVLALVELGKLGETSLVLYPFSDELVVGVAGVAAVAPLGMHNS